MILRVIVNECRVSLFFVAFLFPQHHDAARRQSYAKIVQGECNFRASECRAELVRAMPSAAENLKAKMSKKNVC